MILHVSLPGHQILLVRKGWPWLDLLRQRPHVPGPDLAGERTRIVARSVAREVLADAFDITGQQREDIRIVIGIDGLREIDHLHAPLPVEDIVSRQIAMNATVHQREFDIMQDALEEGLHLLLFEHDIVQTRSWLSGGTDVLHQDSVADLGNRARNVGPMRKEQTLRLILVLDPGRDLGGASLLRLACGGAATPAVAVLRLPLLIALDAAEAIDGVVAQATKHARTIDLRREVLHAR